MTDKQQIAAAKYFVSHWTGKGYEKGESQPFWLSLLRDVYGIEHPEEFIVFEDQVHLDHTSFIDGFIPATRVLIEQKGSGKDLRKPIKQSDGSLLTPFQQAKRYITELPLSQHPRWVVTCNFSSFYVYDMERPGGEPEEILLADLPKEYYRLSFLTDAGNVHLQREMEVSMQAGEIVGLLYDAFLKQYGANPNEAELKNLNVLCVRLVFCLYAEDAGIFGRHDMFHDYLMSYDAHHTRKALIELFQILDTAAEERDKFLEAELAQFPYVNGGLFADKKIEVPPFTEEMRNLLLNRASADFDWSEISPTIFGAVFESTLNPDTRRAGGMHYTSIENIHKLIDPLFMNSLEKELAEICDISISSARKKKLQDFQDNLADLVFLDPACGSGNFLTETYLSLRRLENTVISELHNGQLILGDYEPIKVSIGQFYGIEINDFAVTVAKTALWIAESQMMKATEEIVHMQLDFLPLRSYANIAEANALKIEWESAAPKNELNYIIGNPPFVGYSNQSGEQKTDMLSVYVDEKGKPFKTSGKIDYVAAWYYKAAKLLQGTKIRAAFVSTNSITQGEQAAAVWKPLFDLFGIHIDFAWRSFVWDSESSQRAHVHCVIVGFSTVDGIEKRIYDFTKQSPAENINPYLIDAANVFVESRQKPLCPVPEMITGNRPADGRRKLAETPALFRKTNTPDNYIIVPATSSEKRKYIPMGFLTSDTVASNSALIIPNAALYHFGILTSNVHMAWVQAVCGRLKSDYRYSKDIVYNNFPWPVVTDKQKENIARLAQSILDTRLLFPNSSLADLYSPFTMPRGLLEDHRALDRAVMNAYGFTQKGMTESDCVAKLLELYKALTGKG